MLVSLRLLPGLKVSGGGGGGGGRKVIMFQISSYLLERKEKSKNASKYKRKLNLLAAKTVSMLDW